MNGNNLAVGNFVRWKADRMFKAWDTYGIVTNLHNGATIMTYDDFKETKIELNGEAMTEEITSASKEDVALYLRKKKVAMNAEIETIKIEAEEKARIIAVNLERVDTCIKQLSE